MATTICNNNNNNKMEANRDVLKTQTSRRGRVVACRYLRHMASPKIAWPAVSLHIILSLSLSFSVGFFWFPVSRHDFSFE
jgi:hypothetical protein